MLDNFIKEIKASENFTDSDIDLFIGSLDERWVKKGEHILQEGQVCHYISYIESGLTMMYEINNGIETPSCFVAENEWIGSIKSFSESIPASKAIKALEDTHLFRLSADKLKQLNNQQPKYMSFMNEYLERTLLNVAHTSASFRLLDAKSRYYTFIKDHPKLSNRIPQYYIAAYLGIKPQSLSRIRKKLQ